MSEVCDLTLGHQSVSNRHWVSCESCCNWCCFFPLLRLLFSTNRLLLEEARRIWWAVQSFQLRMRDRSGYGGWNAGRGSWCFCWLSRFWSFWLRTYGTHAVIYLSQEETLKKMGPRASLTPLTFHKLNI